MPGLVLVPCAERWTLSTWCVSRLANVTAVPISRAHNVQAARAAMTNVVCQ
jgi:hypothetical protein